MTKPSTPTKKRSKANSPERKKGQATGDATVRVSEKPASSQPGPSAKDVRSKKRSTDTRGSKERGPKRERPTPKPADQQVPTAAETAAKQKIRRDDSVAAPVEVQKVKGQEVEVVAEPHRVDPDELNPIRRDTLLKDKLRSEGKADQADAPVRSQQGGEWESEDVKLGG